VNVGFVLLSYQRDAPAGMERSVAGLLRGLSALGHRGVVLSASPEAVGDSDVVPIRSLVVRFPSDDTRLRVAIQRAVGLEEEVESILRHHAIDIVCYVDALWGMGRRLLTTGSFRTVLAVHVVGHRVDLEAALCRNPAAVLAPSRSVLEQAARQDYDTARWKVVPNSLLTEQDQAPCVAAREARRRSGPIRAIARLGPEKGILPLLTSTPANRYRATEVAVALAGFERDPGSQRRLLEECRAAATSRGIKVLPGLPWDGVAPFLASASVTLVPSRSETFGLVALESMSVGTPVVAFAVGNFPDLVGGAGALVPQAAGTAGLWRAARDLLADPVRYRAASRAGLARAEPYRPAAVAEEWMEAVLL